MSAREVVDQFIDLFYVKKEVRLAFETWVHPDYIQHKPSLPDGREPVIVFLEKLLERFPDRTFTIHRVISSDDLVAVHCHSQATPEDLGFAVVDIFRVEDCHMVEHWDVLQSVPHTLRMTIRCSEVPVMSALGHKPSYYRRFLERLLYDVKQPLSQLPGDRLSSANSGRL